METVFIYGLLDPVTRELRYIGKSSDPGRRLGQHLYDAYRKISHCASWVRSLCAKGSRPVFQIVDEVLEAEWKAAEAAYIQFYREQGCDLTNTTQGGDGAEMSTALRGERHPNFGKPRSLETRLKTGLAQKGKVISAEHRRKISAALKGNPGYWTGKKMPEAVRARVKAGYRKGLEHKWVNICISQLWN